MSSQDRIAAMTADITAWRRDLHQHPELLYAVHRTAGVVAEKLRSFGVDEVVTGLGQTGVVGVIRGRGKTGSGGTGGGTGSGKVIALRADMDALPIDEQTNRIYASKTPGMMHACGHDGHTAMLLGAARYLAETRDFDGTAIVIFQPAEEGGAGAKAMIEDGVLDRFGIQEVYGMHNMPGLPRGHFAMRPGPMMASADRFEIEIEGRGGHAAKPDQCIDTVLVATQIVNMLQSIVARNVNPLHSAVLSVTSIHAGEVFNVIPQTATLLGTVRTLTQETRDFMEERLRIVTTTNRAGAGRDGADRLQARLSGDGERCVTHEFCGRCGAQGGGRGQCRSLDPADDGSGGFLLHAGAASGCLCLHRQRGQRFPASSGL